VKSQSSVFLFQRLLRHLDAGAYRERQASSGTSEVRCLIPFPSRQEEMAESWSGGSARGRGVRTAGGSEAGLVFLDQFPAACPGQE